MLNGFADFLLSVYLFLGIIVASSSATIKVLERERSILHLPDTTLCYHAYDWYFHHGEYYAVPVQ